MSRVIHTIGVLAALAPAAGAQERAPGRVVAVTFDDLPVTGPKVSEEQ